MNCEICGMQSGPVYSIKIPKDSHKPFTYVCKSCAIKKGIFCLKHEILHEGFVDGTTACIACTEEVLVFHELCGIEEVYADIRGILPYFEAMLFDEAIGTVATYSQNYKSVVLFRYIVSASARSGVPVQDMVNRIKSRKTIKKILCGMSDP